MLPPEYQSQIDAFRKKQLLAQLLQKQGLNPQMAQSQGRMAARTSPLSFLSSALSAYVGTQADAKADQGISGVKQKYATDAQGAIDQFLQAPETEQMALGAKSQFPQVQSIAKALADRRQKAIEAGATIAGKVDPNAGLGMLQSGQFPTAPVQPRAVKPSEEGTLSDGTRFVRDFNPDGTPTTRLVRPPISITNQIPRAESRMGLDVLEAGLKPREDAAVAAKNVISATNRAVDALERGAQAGGGENIKQALRKGLQAFGVTPAATAETNELEMALGTAILSEAAKIKPISNTDIATLEKIVGSIGTDPNALARALAFMQAESIRGLQNFGRYVEEQGATVQDPVAKQRLAGVTIGSELPNQLFGPQSFQMGVLQALKQNGGDLSRFRIGGQPIPEDAQFNISPGKGFPAAREKAPAPVLTVDQLTPAQKEMLLKKLQGG
jgi:hypothetical protein